MTHSGAERAGGTSHVPSNNVLSPSGVASRTEYETGAAIAQPFVPSVVAGAARKMTMTLTGFSITCGASTSSTSPQPSRDTNAVKKRASVSGVGRGPPSRQPVLQRWSECGAGCHALVAATVAPRDEGECEHDGDGWKDALNGCESAAADEAAPALLGRVDRPVAHVAVRVAPDVYGAVNLLLPRGRPLRSRPWVGKRRERRLGCVRLDAPLCSRSAEAHSVTAAGRSVPLRWGRTALPVHMSCRPKSPSRLHQPQSNGAGFAKRRSR